MGEGEVGRVASPDAAFTAAQLTVAEDHKLVLVRTTHQARADRGEGSRVEALQREGKYRLPPRVVTRDLFTVGDVHKPVHVNQGLVEEPVGVEVGVDAEGVLPLHFAR